MNKQILGRSSYGGVGSLGQLARVGNPSSKMHDHVKLRLQTNRRIWIAEAKISFIIELAI